MAYEEAIRSITLNADATVALKTGVNGLGATPNKGFQYRFVRVTGERKCGLTTATGQKTVGVLQNKPQVVGDACTVAIRGVSLIEAGDAIAAADYITTNATGQAIVGDADNGLGIALAAATAANELVPVLLRVN